MIKQYKVTLKQKQEQVMIKQYKVTLKQAVEVTGFINAKDLEDLNHQVDMIEGCVNEAVYGQIAFEYGEVEIEDFENV